MTQFNAYVAKLNWFLPTAVIPLTGWAVTAAELLLGLGLLVGWQLRWVSLASALVLLSFGLTMFLALGLKAPLSLPRVQLFYFLQCKGKRNEV